MIEAELNFLVTDSVIHTNVTPTERGVYEVTYTPKICGRHTLIVKVNDTQIAGSPFQALAKIHPTKLGELLRVVKGMWWPHGMALNSKQQLVIARFGMERVIVLEYKQSHVINFPILLE